MSRIYAVVEGDGEQRFGQQVLAPYLGTRGIDCRFTKAGLPGHKAGVAPWPQIRCDVLRFLHLNKPDQPVFVTTMYDYYRMPLDWPGRKAAEDVPWQDRADVVESALAADVSQEMGDDFIESRFIPYVQLHELEALILSRPDTLKREFPSRVADVDALIAEIGDAAPESIDDGHETSPSRRIIAHIPEYRGLKGVAAANVLGMIPLETLRERCEHFDRWLAVLLKVGCAGSRG